jgi:hypothetical protein
VLHVSPSLGKDEELNRFIMTLMPISAAVILMVFVACPFLTQANFQTEHDSRGRNSRMNLAPNPSFEDGEEYPIGWEIEGRGEGTFRWKAAQGHAGNHSLSIRNPSADSNLRWTARQFIPIEPDHDYEISAWYRNTTQTSSIAFLAVFWGEDQFALGSTGIWQMKPTTDWTYRSFVITANQIRKSFPGANRVQLSFGGSTRIQERGAIWIDDVGFRDVTPNREE